MSKEKVIVDPVDRGHIDTLTDQTRTTAQGCVRRLGNLLTAITWCTRIGDVMARSLQPYLGGIETRKTRIEKTHRIILVF